VRRFAPILCAAIVLGALVAPPALLAQDPGADTPDGGDPPAASDPPIAGGAPEVPDADPGPAHPALPALPAGGSGASDRGRVAARATAAATKPVAMRDFEFAPATVRVSVGDRVTWVNEGPNEPHNATADDGSFATGDLAVGETASETFDRAGTFRYTCTLHPSQMRGKVVVAQDEGGGGGGASERSGEADGEDPGTAAAVPAGPTEAQAASAPDAAGTASKLPSTGLPAGALALVGVACLALGAAIRPARPA
jgi:plastocyanin